MISQQENLNFKRAWSQEAPPILCCDECENAAGKRGLCCGQHSRIKIAQQIIASDEKKKKNLKSCEKLARMKDNKTFFIWKRDTAFLTPTICLIWKTSFWKMLKNERRKIVTCVSCLLLLIFWDQTRDRNSSVEYFRNSILIFWLKIFLKHAFYVFLIV